MAIGYICLSYNSREEKGPLILHYGHDEGKWGLVWGLKEGNAYCASQKDCFTRLKSHIPTLGFMIEICIYLQYSSSSSLTTTSPTSYKTLINSQLIHLINTRHTRTTHTTHDTRTLHTHTHNTTGHVRRRRRKHAKDHRRGHAQAKDGREASPSRKSDGGRARARRGRYVGVCVCVTICREGGLVKTMCRCVCMCDDV